MVLPEPQRRALLLDAAAEVFLSRGYAATTMSDIAVQARMSKKTLYQVFPSKLALFDALLEDRIFLQLPAAPPCSDGSQAESLARLIMALADAMLRPDRTALVRLVINDGQAFPELATAFERLKMAKRMTDLERWFEQQIAAGALPECDTYEITRLLFGMTIAEPLLLALCRAPAERSGPTMEERVRQAVRIFLSGLGATCAK